MSTLAVTHLALSHFRSHRHAQIDLSPGPVAIFGANGAGKTNLIEAISLLSPGRGLRRAGAEDLVRRPESVGWRIGAEVTVPGGGHEIDTRAEAGRPRETRIDGKAVPQVALGRIVRMLWLVPSMDRLWIEGADGRRRFWDRMTMSFEPGHGDAVLTYDKAMRERNRLLKDQVRDSAWYGALEARMAEAGAVIIANRTMALDRVHAAQGAAATAFPVSALTALQPDGDKAVTAEDLSAAFGDGRRRDLAAGRTLTGPHRADLGAEYTAKGVSAAQCSTGEQKALLISLILANARALATDTGAAPILLLDEVAAHLDTGRRAALFDELRALGAQVFLTGTGRELFAELDGYAQMLDVRDDPDGSVVKAG
ncbi:DNA replication/repair protein RecF [Oceaniovalibus sp. ACAM 378]|uniref:DNA replication/repair protein RecF n=1 Tax=Oceaniovalibus sp. ACAM 378 TaxID=2599923 RepID=UPI0011D854E4|nr:DNA replication/repair protein RecF [Oceaniovalibus sp. ACAM 378]TYB84914.1 DNA replication/repair protein RecF [Oceaniovalibus sp. ACAM 378]